MIFDERESIERARAGCRRSFARLWNEHAGRVRAVVARLVPPGLVEDVVQDVALGALAGIGACRADGGIVGWLLSIARHRAASALQRLRQQRARGEVSDAVDTLQGREVGRPPRGLRRELRALLRRLPRGYRLPVWWRYVTGCSATEIAARLGTTRGTVRVALCRGLQQLRGMVHEPWLY